MSPRSADSFAGRRVARRPRPRIDPVLLPHGLSNSLSSLAVESPADLAESKTYIGLDPSWTGYGVVIWRSHGQHQSHLIKTDPMPSGRRAVCLLNALLDVLPPHADGVCIEGFNRGARNGREEAGASNIVTMLALQQVYGDTRVAVPTPVAPQTLKKFITGSGKGDKNLVLKAVYKKWDVDFDNDNLADAYGLARLAAAVASGSSDLAYEREVLETLKKSEQTWEPPQESSPPRARVVSR